MTQISKRRATVYWTGFSIIVVLILTLLVRPTGLFVATPK